mmetsp:Transcript_9410/g.29370  ORF Transcript_9410/g.29370 Transcript_9410/m.29370 type:complete len:241 (+) Transcript_9410:331-1053(+)
MAYSLLACERPRALDLADKAGRPEDTREQHRKARVRAYDGEKEARPAEARQATEARVVAVWPVHARAGARPDVGILQQVPCEVEHDQRHRQRAEVRRPMSAPVRALALGHVALPVHVLRYVGERRKGHGGAQGVAEALGGGRGGNAQRAGQEEGPASGSHQSGHRHDHCQQRAPELALARLGRGVGRGGVGRLLVALSARAASGAVGAVVFSGNSQKSSVCVVIGAHLEARERTGRARKV